MVDRADHRRFLSFGKKERKKTKKKKNTGVIALAFHSAAVKIIRANKNP